MQIDKSIKVEQATDDLMQKVAALLAAAKKDHAAGVSWAAALPLDVVALVQNLPGIVSDASQVSGDLADSKVVFAKTIACGAFDIAAAVIG